MIAGRAGQHSELLRKAGGSFIIQLVGAAAAFFLQAALARVLGARSFGDYVFAITVTNFLTLFCVFGFDSASLRFIPEYKSKQSLGLLAGYLRTSFYFVTAMSIAMGIVWLSLLRFGFTSMEPDLRRVLSLACILVPLNAIIVLRSAALRAIRDVVSALAPSLVVRPVVVFALFFGAFIIFGVRPSAQLAMMAAVGSAITVLALLLFVSKRRMRDIAGTSNNVDQAGHWLRVAAPMMLITGFNLVLSQADILMLGMLEGTSATGIYVVASRVANLMTFILAAVNVIAAPMIAQLYAENRLVELQALLTLASKVIFVASVAAALAIIIPREFILSLFGSDFRQAAPALLVLAGAQLLNALAGSVGYLMTMTGHQNRALGILAISAATNVALNGLLIPRFGILGAAYATALSTVLWNVLMWVSVKRTLGVNPTVFSLLSPGK